MRGAWCVFVDNAGMPNQSIIPADIAERYEVFEWRNGLAILSSAHPGKWADILEVLRGFHLQVQYRLAQGAQRRRIRWPGRWILLPECHRTDFVWRARKECPNACTGAAAGKFVSDAQARAFAQT